MLVLSAISSAKSTATTSVYVDPETYEVSGLGQTFTINVTVAEVTDLCAWEFQLFYNSTHLNGTDVGEGPFLKTAGATFFWVVNMTDNYNATHGYIHAFCILTPVIPGANETGVIANVTFKSKAPGSSILDLTDTKLKNSEGEYMSHETRDGIIIVKMLGDVNGDGKVNYKDLYLLLIAYGSSEEDPNYNPEADFNRDGKVNYKDLYILLVNYGKT